MLRRRVCILFSLLLCLSACLTAEASTVCAVLPALRSEVERNLADRLETELSKEENLVLVNRAELQAIAEEQLLSQVFGKDSPQLLRKISKSFRADLLVILTHTVSGDEEFIRVLYAESTYGCRLLQELLPYSGKNADDLVRHIVSSFREVRARYADGTKWIIAVPPFVSRNLVQDYHELRARFSHIVESALSLFPGMAVLAFEEAQSIQNEKLLPAAIRSVVYYLSL